MALLEAQGMNSYYGDSHILFDVALRVERHEVVALLGRNGAGKSTTLKSLMGVVTPRAGSVTRNRSWSAFEAKPTLYPTGGPKRSARIRTNFV